VAAPVCDRDEPDATSPAPHDYVRTGLSDPARLEPPVEYLRCQRCGREAERWLIE